MKPEGYCRSRFVSESRALFESLPLLTRTLEVIFWHSMCYSIEWQNDIEMELSHSGHRQSAANIGSRQDPSRCRTHGQPFIVLIVYCLA